MSVFNFTEFKKIAEAAGDTRPKHVVARTGLNSGLVSRLIAEEREPSLKTAKRLAVAYRVSLDLLTRGEEAA